MFLLLFECFYIYGFGAHTPTFVLMAVKSGMEKAISKPHSRHLSNWNNSIYVARILQVINDKHYATHGLHCQTTTTVYQRKCYRDAWQSHMPPSSSNFCEMTSLLAYLDVDWNHTYTCHSCQLAASALGDTVRFNGATNQASELQLMISCKLLRMD